MRKKIHAPILFITSFILFFSFLQLFSLDRKGHRTHIQILENTLERNQQSYNWLLSTPEAQGLSSSIFQRAIQHAKDLEFVDNLLVVRNGYLIVEEYFDGSDQDTPHLIASASKTFIGALVGIAARENLLTLDQKLTDFYPEYVTPNMDPRKYDITIRHMLQMLSGFWDVDTMLSSNWIKYAIEYLPLYSDPGLEFHYSTIGVHLLSGIITRVSGMSTLDFAQKYLFDPIGISVASWSQDPAGIYTGGFGMSFTPRNLAQFGYLYEQKGMVDGLQIIPEDYFQESWIKSDPSRGMLDYDAVEESGYGYLWWIGKMGGYWSYLARGHGGQYVIVIPDLNMVIVLNGKLYYYALDHHVRNFRLFAYLILYPIRDWLGDPPYAPENAWGCKHINRSLFYKEYINEITWEPSSRNLGINVSEYRIYKFHSAANRELLATVDTNTLSFRQRGTDIQEESEHIYGITTVTSDHKESIPAFVLIYGPEDEGDQ